MAVSEILLPWDRQPQEAVGINAGSALAAGLQFCVLPGVSRRDLVTGELWLPFGTEPGIAPNGVGTALNASSSGGLYLDSSVNNVCTAGQTHIFVVSPTAISGAYGGLFAAADSGGSNTSLAIQDSGAGTGLNYLWTDNAGGAGITALPLAQPAPYVLVLVAGGGSLGIYVNGVSYGTPLVSPTTRSTCRVVLHGARDASSTYSTTGQTNFYAGFARRFSDNEIAAVSASLVRPFGELLAPQRILFPSGSAPVITAQPTEQTAADGGTAVFSATVTGATSYQWQYRSPTGSAYASVSGGSGGTSSAWTTDTLARSDAGTLVRLKATNAVGDTYSNEVLLRVTQIPTSYAASVGLVVGSSLSWVGHSYVGASDASATAVAAGSATIVFDARGEGSAVASGSADGSANIVFGMTGVGAARTASAGSSSLVFDVAGIGAARSSGAANADIVFGVQGVGASRASGDGSTAIVLSQTGVGAARQGAAGSTSITLDALGAGAASVVATGSTSIVFNVQGVGAAAAAGTAAGSADIVVGAQGAGASRVAGAGSAGLVFDAPGEGASRVSAAGLQQIVFDVRGVGFESAPTIVSADGSASIVLSMFGDTNQATAVSDGGKSRGRVRREPVAYDEEAELMEIMVAALPMLRARGMLWDR